MYTKEQLLQQLEEMNVDPFGTILIHSSMKSIGDVENRADTVLDALIEYMKEGLLVFPTHTWSYINEENPVFSVNDSKVCIGILPELFRKKEGVMRSLHPTHSVAALGKEAPSFVDSDHKYDTPCARGSSWGKLLDRDATILLVGVDLRRNTVIHGIEEWLNVSGRLANVPEQLYVENGDGDRILVPQHRHFGEHWSEFFYKVEDVFLEYGAMRFGKLGDATVRLCSTKKMYDILVQMIAINSELFSDNLPLERERYTIVLP